MMTLTQILGLNENKSFIEVDNWCDFIKDEKNPTAFIKIDPDLDLEKHDVPDSKLSIYNYQKKIVDTIIKFENQGFTYINLYGKKYKLHTDHVYLSLPFGTGKSFISMALSLYSQIPNSRKIIKSCNKSNLYYAASVKELFNNKLADTKLENKLKPTWYLTKCEDEKYSFPSCISYNTMFEDIDDQHIIKTNLYFIKKNLYFTMFKYFENIYKAGKKNILVIKNNDYIIEFLKSYFNDGLSIYELFNQYDFIIAVDTIFNETELQKIAIELSKFDTEFMMDENLNIYSRLKELFEQEKNISIYDIIKLLLLESNNYAARVIYDDFDILNDIAYDNKEIPAIKYLCISGTNNEKKKQFNTFKTSTKISKIRNSLNITCISESLNKLFKLIKPKMKIISCNRCYIYNIIIKLMQLHDINDNTIKQWMKYYENEDKKFISESGKIYYQLTKTNLDVTQFNECIKKIFMYFISKYTFEILKSRFYNLKVTNTNLILKNFDDFKNDYSIDDFSRLIFEFNENLIKYKNEIKFYTDNNKNLMLLKKFHANYLNNNITSVIEKNELVTKNKIKYIKEQQNYINNINKNIKNVSEEDKSKLVNEINESTNIIKNTINNEIEVLNEIVLHKKIETINFRNKILEISTSIDKCPCVYEEENKIILLEIIYKSFIMMDIPNTDEELVNILCTNQTFIQLMLYSPILFTSIFNYIKKTSLTNYIKDKFSNIIKNNINLYETIKKNFNNKINLKKRNEYSKLITGISCTKCGKCSNLLLMMPCCLNSFCQTCFEKYVKYNNKDSYCPICNKYMTNNIKLISFNKEFLNDPKLIIKSTDSIRFGNVSYIEKLNKIPKIFIKKNFFSSNIIPHLKPNLDENLNELDKLFEKDVSLFDKNKTINLLKNNKTVIFSMNENNYDHIKKYITNLKKMIAIKNYDNPDGPLFISGIKNVSGINLQKYNTLIIYHPIENINIKSQLIGRFQRIGRSKKDQLNIYQLTY